MFKKGDEIRVKDSLIIGQMYGGITWLSSMNRELKNKVLIVREITNTGRLYVTQGYILSYEMITLADRNLI